MLTGSASLHGWQYRPVLFDSLILTFTKMSLRFLLCLKVTSSLWVGSREGLTFWRRNLDCRIPCEMWEWAGSNVTISGMLISVTGRGGAFNSVDHSTRAAIDWESMIRHMG